MRSATVRRSVGVLILCMLAGAGLPLPAAVLSIGHRGNSLFAPENTVAAFRAALGKADLVELDAQVSSDGQLVVMHDTTVDRTTDGTGSLASMSLAQLKLLDAGSWFAPNFIGERVPTVAEALTNILPHATPLIERKTGTVTAYVNLLHTLGVTTNVIVQSFDWTFLAVVYALDPSLRLAALGSGALTATQITSITNSGARTVAWEKPNVTATEVALVHEAGLSLFVRTVDGPEIQIFPD